MNSNAMVDAAKTVVKRLPYIRRLHEDIRGLKAELAKWRTWKPPGHFYSPIPALDELRADAARIFQNTVPPLGGIALNHERQVELLGHFAKYYRELPEQWNCAGLSRYHYANAYYSWADAIVLYCMLRHLAPKRIVEVGSGFSSAVVLDIDEMYLGASILCTFIDPFPKRLLELLRPEDSARCAIVPQRLQAVPLETFTALEKGDILLVDSSHVSKTGSDVNRLLFEVLPALAPGVHIHFHDVFYPFEYPQSWVEQGVSWNEAYLLRAFLQYNNAFTIQFFTSYLVRRHPELLASHIPLAMRSECDSPSLSDAPGGSLWLLRENVAE